MDNPILGWNIESGQNKSLGVDDGLVELLWQNGQVVLNSQTHRKPGYGNDTSKHEEGGTIRIRNPSNLCEVDETDSWIDESFEKEVSWQFEGTRTTGHQSIMTVGSSHCGSNDQVVIKNFGGKLSPRSESMERATVITTSSGSSFGKTTCDQSTDNINFNSNKRKIREEDTSDQLEPGPGGGKSSRTSRAAQVHNLSERRRRDRINEKMRALQELIPHSNKSDKASMLDEAIEYMKSLQLQVQMMWMGNGIFQQYMSRMGMGMGLGMGIVPSIHNVPIHLLRMPLQVDQQISMQNHAAIHQNPVLNPVINYQNPKFHDQYANYMAFHQLQNASQPMNMFNFRSHTSQQNHMQPPAKSNGSNGQL